MSEYKPSEVETHSEIHDNIKLFVNRDPNNNDTNNVFLGDLWLNRESNDVFMLISIARTIMSKDIIATWIKLDKI